jgi:hypothetical protein
VGTPGVIAVGIYSDISRRSISVHDGAVTNFDHGVFLESNGTTVERIRAMNNRGIGIRVGFGSFASGNGHRVVSNIARRNTFGINVSCAAVILFNVAEDNEGGDIIADPGRCTRLGNNPLP